MPGEGEIVVVDVDEVFAVKGIDDRQVLGRIADGKVEILAAAIITVGPDKAHAVTQTASPRAKTVVALWELLVAADLSLCFGRFQWLVAWTAH
jgi:hypothetical protein